MEKHHDGSSNQGSGENGSFVPPRHWVSPDQLDSKYWDDAKNDSQQGEFPERPLDVMEKLSNLGESEKGLARRQFLTVMGASMAMASFACSRRPVHKIIPYVVKPEEITPGVPNWYASTCKACESGCGILVKTREGRPIKLEGNPDHPANEGSLCTQGQASVLDLYDPDRLTKPRTRGDLGRFQDVSWDEADSAIAQKLMEFRKAKKEIRVLTNGVSGQTTQKLIDDFLESFGTSESGHVEYEPLAMEKLHEARDLSYGDAGMPDYFFDRADVVLSLNADFLHTWGSHVQYSKDWAKKRKLTGGKTTMSRLLSVESVYSLTGSNADERFSVAAGQELLFAAGILRSWTDSGYSHSLLSTSQVKAFVAKTNLKSVSDQLNIPVKKIQEVADELWAAKGKSIVLAGGITSSTETELELQVVANLMNAVLDNDGKTVVGQTTHRKRPVGYQGIQKLVADIEQDKVGALIIHGTNPVYSLSGDPRFEKALAKVPLVVVISERADETAHLAHYQLPAHHYLENWGDGSAFRGKVSLQQPAIAPIHDSRAFEDCLLLWSKNAGIPTSMIQQSQDWHAYLQNNWKKTAYQSKAQKASFKQFWEGALRQGVYETGESNKSTRSFRTSALDYLGLPKKQSPDEIKLVLYVKGAIHDGRGANNPWLQELPDPISTITWDNYLNVGPALAKKLSVSENDVVKVTTEKGFVELPVHIQPGTHRNVVSVAVGYGRKRAGKVGNGAGVDLYPLVSYQKDSAVFSGANVKVEKTGMVYQLASAQWHSSSENRPIVNDVTLSEINANRGASNHTNPHLKLHEVPSMWPEHKYPEYKWGMAIDLNACTGCGACVVACQAENNIPVVGRDQVRVSRQMHWIKIDRYYSGSPENPQALFQPMLCQHCDNAPCETVCPVLATVHNDEGLNLQVYNRCVGTRYCQNNCPYKVRRFNFFDHWKSYQGTMNMAWNPDVTVRTRGIMEKCTFCTQRIRAAKDLAKDNNEKVKDGDFQVACQQTCSTGAIVFGNLSDPESRVSKLARDQMSFKVLEVLNTQPAISYMSKVRNVSEKVKGNAHGHA